MIRILHVDDDRNDLELTKYNLAKLSKDLEIEWCESVQEALDRLQTEDFHCIISDYMMPDRDGLEFLRELRSRGDETPFIFFTGHGNEEIAAQALRSGADDYFARGIGDSSYERLYYGIERAYKLHERKRMHSEMEQALRESEERYRSLFDGSKDVVYITSKDGRMININPAGEELFGYSREELLSMDVNSLYANPKDREGFRTEIESTGFVKEYPVALRRRGGSIIHCLITSSVHEGGSGGQTYYQGIIRDITEQRWLQDTLRKLSSAVEQSSSSVLITDTEGWIEYVNPRFTRLTGYGFDELIGDIPYILREGALPQDELEELWREIRSGGEWRREFKNRKKNGEEFWEYVSISPIRDSEDKISNFLIVSEDITELVQARQQVEEANRELGQINRQLEEAIERANRLAIESQAANIAKSQFLANMSHEIRTPLNGIIGMTELALDTDLSSEQREYLDLAYESATSLLSLINDILDFSKIEAGKLELDPIPFRLRDNIGDSIKGLSVKAHAKGLEMAVRIPNDVPDAVVGDPGRLRQILVNLVGNAIKFTEEGEIVVEVVTESSSDEDVLLHFLIRQNRKTYSRLFPRPTVPPRGSTAAPAWGWLSPPSLSR